MTIGQAVKINSKKAPNEGQKIYNGCYGKIIEIFYSSCRIRLNKEDADKINSLQNKWLTEPIINKEYLSLNKFKRLSLDIL